MRSTTLIFFLIVGLIGCTNTDEPNSASSGDSDKVAQADPGGDVNSDLQSGSESSSGDDVLITLETPPEMICRAFIDCLRRGDHAKAEKFLSQESIAQTRKQSLDLAMPAGKDALYTISAPVFATSQQKIAFVSIEVTEPAEPNAPPQPFSMMLRNGSFGWKISGMMLGSESATQDLYSFENPLDVLRIKSMLEGDSRQARVPDAAGEYRLP